MKHNYIGQQDFPLDAVMPLLAQQYAEIIVGSVVALAYLYAIKNLIKQRDSRLLICLLAGLIAVPMESHAMGLMKFVYPPIGQHILYTGFGRSVPVFMGLMYSVFYGVANYLYLSSSLSGKWSVKAFWFGIAAIIACETLLEVVCINLGLWAYFDDQPFMVLDFPIHVAIVVACMCMIYGAASKVWFDRVEKSKQWLLLIVGPAVLIGTCTVFSFPLALGLDAAKPVPAIYIGSLISIILGIVFSYLIVKELSSK